MSWAIGFMGLWAAFSAFFVAGYLLGAIMGKGTPCSGCEEIEAARAGEGR